MLPLKAVVFGPNGMFGQVLIVPFPRAHIRLRFLLYCPHSPVSENSLPVTASNSPLSPFKTPTFGPPVDPPTSAHVLGLHSYHYQRLCACILAYPLGTRSHLYLDINAAGMGYRCRLSNLKKRIYLGSRKLSTRVSCAINDFNLQRLIPIPQPITLERSPSLDSAIFSTPPYPNSITPSSGIAAGHMSVALLLTDVRRLAFRTEEMHSARRPFTTALHRPLHLHKRATPCH
ncbi:hypothetical protein FA13DRAFT_163018 [Coprinellus micaceus]|uniref:Uncharacterized protein n=1 Tax=Coprinellus micaceus TaxID=71717 RepID=A0A4Y7THF4_COPMI|nr:hypothetical protein FA13DRAFT_163018 [Coprinellus micaceus]